MGSDLMKSLESASSLPANERAGALLDIGSRVVSGDGNGASADLSAVLVAQVVDVLGQQAGSGRERLSLGELLASLGDPRLKTPDQSEYWATVKSETGDVVIGKYPVTNYEFRRWSDGGGYVKESSWSADGWAWRQDTSDLWPVRASSEGAEQFVVPNQPVVGVSWYEAEAYANGNNARLPRADERVWVTRGYERRPYPWGSPFGEGNANTREEVLGRPCAVGIYLRDRTPEGVYDLAGNAGEWTVDVVGNDRLIHPGSFDQPSLAAWAKALSIEAPSARWAGLGFRLARG